MTPFLGAVVIRRRLEQEAYRYFDQWTTPPRNRLAGDINEAVKALKTSGLWTNADRIRFIAADIQGGLVDLKTPGTDTLTIVGTPVFTDDLGWTSNSAGYLQSTYNPGDGGSHNYVQNSAALVVGVTGTATSADPISSNADGGGTARITPRTATDGFVTRLNQVSSNGGAGLATVTNRMFTASRNGGTTQQKYINETLVESPTTASAALPNSPRHYLIDSTKALYNTQTLAFIWEGAAINATQVSALFRIYATYMSARGQPVS